MKFLVGIFLGLGLQFYIPPIFAKETKQIVVGIISEKSLQKYQDEVQKEVEDILKSCSKCQIKNFSPYDEEGQFKMADLESQVLKARSETSFLYILWNEKVTDENKKAIEVLRKVISENFLVIGTTGLAKTTEPTLPLNKTVLGSVPGLIIVGDLEARERLPVRSYFGPEMLTAIRSPDENDGPGIGSAYFVGRLANDYYKRESNKAWMDHFQQTKLKTRKLWPGLEEFFGRGSSKNK